MADVPREPQSSNLLSRLDHHVSMPSLNTHMRIFHTCIPQFADFPLCCFAHPNTHLHTEAFTLHCHPLLPLWDGMGVGRGVNLQGLRQEG